MKKKYTPDFDSVLSDLEKGTPIHLIKSYDKINSLFYEILQKYLSFHSKKYRAIELRRLKLQIRSIEHEAKQTRKEAAKTKCVRPVGSKNTSTVRPDSVEVIV